MNWWLTWKQREHNWWGPLLFAVTNDVGIGRFSLFYCMVLKSAHLFGQGQGQIDDLNIMSAGWLAARWSCDVEFSFCVIRVELGCWQDGEGPLFTFYQFWLAGTTDEQKDNQNNKKMRTMTAIVVWLLSAELLQLQHLRRSIKYIRQQQELQTGKCISW